MTRGPEAWRRLVRVGGVTGVFLVAAGYAALEGAPAAWRPAALVAFYGGFALAVAAAVLWYRYVPPRPPAPEEPEKLPETDDEDEEVPR